MSFEAITSTCICGEITRPHPLNPNKICVTCKNTYAKILDELETINIENEEIYSKTEKLLRNNDLVRKSIELEKYRNTKYSDKTSIDILQTNINAEITKISKDMRKIIFILAPHIKPDI